MSRPLNPTYPVHPADMVSLAFELVILLHQQDQWLLMWKSVSIYTVAKLVPFLQKEGQKINPLSWSSWSSFSLVQNTTLSFLLFKSNFTVYSATSKTWFAKTGWILIVVYWKYVVLFAISVFLTGFINIFVINFRRLWCNRKKYGKFSSKRSKKAEMYR